MRDTTSTPLRRKVSLAAMIPRFLAQRPRWGDSSSLLIAVSVMFKTDGQAGRFET